LIFVLRRFVNLTLRYKAFDAAGRGLFKIILKRKRSFILTSADLPGLCSQEHAQSWRVFYCPPIRRPGPVKYPKPSLPFSDQADLLIARGLLNLNVV